ncbi:cupin domain-containing protein [Actinoplanes sp. NPDC023801]|uniref:JmjC domain-containing protein n=1 Tax=Actinoplanes sp. NPDC023801 TaxID=3154595 RepID=UPI0033E221FF
MPHLALASRAHGEGRPTPPAQRSEGKGRLFASRATNSDSTTPTPGGCNVAINVVRQNHGQRHDERLADEAGASPTARRQPPSPRRQRGTHQRLSPHRHRARRAAHRDQRRGGTPLPGIYDGRLPRPGQGREWRGRGYTIQLRNLHRWCPAVHAICAAIQDETGYGTYATGFVTPAGGQGLHHHWDQNMGLIYQLAGRKTWQIWEPGVEEPHREQFASNTPPGSDVLHRMKTTRPDYEFDLGPGQILVLPRGWMHNPHARGQTQESVHVTFVARERTGYWVAGKLAQAALTSTLLRRVIPPADVVDPAAFAQQVAQARDLLTQWLAGADVNTLAADLLQAARTEPNVDYISHAPGQNLIGNHQSAR